MWWFPSAAISARRQETRTPSPRGNHPDLLHPARSGAASANGPRPNSLSASTSLVKPSIPSSGASAIRVSASHSRSRRSSTSALSACFCLMSRGRGYVEGKIAARVEVSGSRTHRAVTLRGLTARSAPVNLAARTSCRTCAPPLSALHRQCPSQLDFETCVFRRCSRAKQSTARHALATII